MQQKQVETTKPKPKANAAPRVTPFDADGYVETVAVRPRKLRKRRIRDNTSKSKKPQRSVSPSPPPLPTDVPPPSSALNSVASFQTETDPISACAAPALDVVPSSPLPQTTARPLHEQTEVEQIIDSNENRKKRRKALSTPPPNCLTTIRVEYDEETGSILNNSPSTERKLRNTRITYSSPPLPDNPSVGKDNPVIINGRMLTIRTSARIKAQDLLSKSMESGSDPALLPTSLEYERPSDPISDPTTPKRKSARIKASYDKEKGLLTFSSSPTTAARIFTPPEPARVNPLTLLGKSKITSKETKGRAAGRKTSKKDNDADNKTEQRKALMDPLPANGALNQLLGKKAVKKKIARDNNETASPEAEPAVSDTSSADQKPPLLKPAINIGKALHPFFNSEKRRQMTKDTPTPVSEPEVNDKQGSPSIVTTSPHQTSECRSTGKPTDSLRMGVPTWPSFGANRTRKTPGLEDAPWPVKGTSHVRGLSPGSIRKDSEYRPMERRLQKSKENAVIVPMDERVIEQLSDHLGIDRLWNDLLAADYAERKYHTIGPELRMPQRIITTGPGLQEMIRHRITSRLPHPEADRAGQPDSDSDSLSIVQTHGKNVHPALMKLYWRIRDELPAFDHNECETISWETKYAPATSFEVMQVGREMEIFTKWLVGLRTDKVDAPIVADARKRKARGSKAKLGAAKKKRRKKAADDDLDGFIIDSEEEGNVMDEVTDREEDNWLSNSPKMKRSTVRAGDKDSDIDIGTRKEKKTNTIVISGPPGCGKTAAVYAVAKELGYTVFEVSPGTRRGGKDVIDLVGEMSRNHLVHQSKTTNEIDNPFARAKSEQNALQAEQGRQQQSLILLDEVDVLFDEDKSFWSAIATLMLNSKRPIVLTCNDESLIPFETLSLHAILRFSTPPRGLIVDYLLLLCANEGHLLQRQAVDALVESNGNDLRRSLMQLQFHCRMGIGDRKGGLDWQLVRWPVGCDEAENGHTLRVVSRDTYCIGMGWVNNGRTDVESQWLDAWEIWGINMVNEELDDVRVGAETDKRPSAALGCMQEYAEACSAADAFAGFALQKNNVGRHSILAVSCTSN